MALLALPYLTLRAVPETNQMINPQDWASNQMIAEAEADNRTISCAIS
jgi:hypothetical protein